MARSESAGGSLYGLTGELEPDRGAPAVPLGPPRITELLDQGEPAAADRVGLRQLRRQGRRLPLVPDQDEEPRLVQIQPYPRATAGVQQRVRAQLVQAQHRDLDLVLVDPPAGEELPGPAPSRAGGGHRSRPAGRGSWSAVAPP